MHTFLSLLAQAQPSQPAQPGPQTSPSFSMLLPAFLMAFLVFMILSSRSQRKREQRERQMMFDGLARSDRVLTTGGIIGTVLSVKENEIVLKVDESTNTKMTFVKTAIQRVLKDDDPGELKK
jgi:preprotein translocase subunit YajC